MDAKFEKEIERIFDLVEKGELPKTAIPRMVYCGHKLVATIFLTYRTLYCITCKNSWSADRRFIRVCQTCNTVDNVYDITGDSHKGIWRCLVCSHEWTSEDGYTCPHCNSTVDNFGNVVNDEGKDN